MSAKNDHDIHELQPSQQLLSGVKYRKYLCYVAQAAVWAADVYFLVRVGLILTAAQQTWQMWLMVIIEWIFARLSRQNQLLTVSAGSTSQLVRKRLRLRGRKDLDHPLVDVLVACCGEPIDVILDTVRAACCIDYPTSRFRVLLLDDGGSSALRDAVAQLRSTWPHLFYHTRGKHSGRVFAKAGNLNYALFSLQEDFQPEYCAIFDADCMPSPDFLRATLPHLLQNPQAALLTSRQHYYNLPSGDPLCQSRIHFYACHNTELDLQGVAIDAGSGAVFRRRAILDAGGYPTFSFSEDWQLSLVLQGRGYSTMQLEEPLQFGLVPTSLQGHVAQRNRWNIGHSQQIYALLPPTNKSLPGALQWSIAVNGVLIVLGLAGYSVGFFAVPALLLSGQLIPTPSPLLLKVQVVLALVHVALTWQHAWLQAASTGFRVPLFSHLENSWLASRHLYAIIKFHFFSSKPKGSFVTGSSANAWNRTTNSSFYKSAMLLCENGILYAVSLFVVTLVAMVYAGWTAVTSSSGDLASRLLTSIAWPPLLHICYLSIGNLWAAVAYLANPPRYPERGSRLAQTEGGIMFPKEAVQGDGQLRSHCSRSLLVASVVLGLVACLVLHDLY